MSRILLVVPCFNEAERMPFARYEAFVASASAPDVGFVLVNDGSTDATLSRLEDLARSDPTRFRVLDRPPNRGKAEAVRAGMLHALGLDATFVGYWDADLATPLEELPRFVRVLEERPLCEVVFGARVQLMGRSIRRSALRHYLGRVFATLASETVGLPIYDTQCGAKLFRAGPRAGALFAEPFLTRWLFDVELVARIVASGGTNGRARAGDAIYELPLRTWHDAGGSKVRLRDFPRSLLDLLAIRRRYPRG
jgi:dolichyl-phosphate beta-glucosyltransferase